MHPSSSFRDMPFRRFLMHRQSLQRLLSRTRLSWIWERLGHFARPFLIVPVSHSPSSPAKNTSFLSTVQSITIEIMSEQNANALTYIGIIITSSVYRCGCISRFELSDSIEKLIDLNPSFVTERVTWPHFVFFLFFSRIVFFWIRFPNFGLRLIFSFPPSLPGNRNHTTCLEKRDEVRQREARLLLTSLKSNEGEFALESRRRSCLDGIINLRRLSPARPKVLLAKKNSNKLFDKLFGEESLSDANYSLSGSNETLVLFKERWKLFHTLRVIPCE